MLIPDLNYNYVVFGSDWDLYKFSYSDLFDKENVRYFDTIQSSLHFLSKLHKVHFSELTNKFFQLPFKNIWNPLYFKNDFVEKDKPLCFVFMGYWPRIVEVTRWIQYLKRKDKRTKCVLFLQDLVSTKTILYTHEPLSQKHFTDYDLVLSFDQGDCEKYGFIYHPLVFSDYHVEIKKPAYDIYFLGQAKNRLKEIIDAYEYLKSLNLKLDFNIIGVRDADRVYDGEIKYITGLTYQENLKHVENSKAILEIMQKGGTGFTQRGCEAVCLDKHLLTNNPAISKEPFYNPDYIKVYHDILDVDNTYGDSLNDPVNFKYKERMSPIELLSFIDKRIDN